MRHHYLAVAALLLLLPACGRGEIEMNSAAFALCVANESDVKIYPVLRSGRYEESFGVVGAKAHKTTDFGPFRLGDALRIDWGEGHINPKKTITLQTKQYKGVKMRKLRVVYSGKGKWSLKAFDEKDKEIKPKPDDKPPAK